MRTRLFAAAAAAVTLATPIFADEVVTKNGSHLIGTVDSAEAGKLNFTSPGLGKTTIALKDVSTFTTDHPITFKLVDGTVIDAQVRAGPDGSITIPGQGNLAAQTVPVTNIKWINFSTAWTGSVAIGGALTRGNSDTDSFNAGFNLARRTEQDRLEFDGGFLYGRQKVTGLPGKHETENNWFLSGQYNYNLIEQSLYAYANARIEKDVIAGIDLRLTPGVGLGYNFADEPDFHARAEGGISYLYRKYAHGGGHDESVAARAAYHIDKNLNAKVSIFHNFEYYPALKRIDDYFFVTDAGLHVALTEKMFSEFKVVEKYDNRPAPGKGRNDTQFILSVGWTL